MDSWQKYISKLNWATKPKTLWEMMSKNKWKILKY